MITSDQGQGRWLIIIASTGTWGSSHLSGGQIEIEVMTGQSMMLPGVSALVKWISFRFTFRAYHRISQPIRFARCCCTTCRAWTGSVAGGAASSGRGGPSTGRATTRGRSSRRSGPRRMRGGGWRRCGVFECCMGRSSSSTSCSGSASRRMELRIPDRGQLCGGERRSQAVSVSNTQAGARNTATESKVGRGLGWSAEWTGKLAREVQRRVGPQRQRLLTRVRGLWTLRSWMRSVPVLSFAVARRAVAHPRTSSTCARSGCSGRHPPQSR